MLSMRQEQAKRSIIVQAHQKESIERVYTWFLKFGAIKNIFLYKSNSNRILFEYAVPWQQKNHYFTFNQKNKAGSRSLPKKMPAVTTVNHMQSKNDDGIQRLLAGQSSIDAQIEALYKYRCIDEVEIRMKFIVALQTQKIACEIFRNAIVCPFGSTVNGCGQINSDLDLVLEWNYKEPNEGYEVRQERFKIQDRLKKLAGHMAAAEYISNVSPILGAAVPILKYELKFLNLNVDVSMNMR